MRVRRIDTRDESGTGQTGKETPSADLPVILLMTRKLELTDPETDALFSQLATRFDIRLVGSPSLALAMSRSVQDNEGQVVLLLSDMLSSGTEVFLFISAFSRDWPDAGFHLIDSLEGRIIFSEPGDSDSDLAPSIHIKSNGRESLDTRLASKVVERYFPKYAAERSIG